MDDCQVPEAQKIHFQKPKLFDLVLFILRLDEPVLRQLDRHIFFYRLGADDDAGCMRAGVP